MAMRRNQLKVQASDSWLPGMTSSAIFNPGEKRETTGTGRFDSFGTIQASARKPTRKPSKAGNTRRTKGGRSIKRNSIKREATRGPGRKPSLRRLNFSEAGLRSPGSQSVG